MLLGCIADDFTGASDLANTLAKGGMSTAQFIGVPGQAAEPEWEAGVVALKTRSVPREDAVAQSLAALDWLEAQGCRQFLFKYCSTFDSTPAGNIGPVAEALLDALAAPLAVVCPAFPATGRTVFMGHLFVGDRLLHQSGMETHPLTPMTEPDLRRWLRLQAEGEIGFVPHGVVRRGAAAISASLDAEVKAGRRLAVVDAVEDRDLLALGRAVAGHRLVTGSSGIAMGLPENFREAGLIGEAQVAFTPLAGPGVVLSGSCSAASRAQLARYLEDHPGLALEPSELMAGRQTVADAVAFVHAHIGKGPAVYSTTTPDRIADAQARFVPQELAREIEEFFGALAARLVEDGIVCLAVGGGETSGAVVTALGIRSLAIGPEIDPGVPALAAIGGKPLRLVLKSGNFGAVDFYEKALGVLGGERYDA